MMQNCSLDVPVSVCRTRCSEATPENDEMLLPCNVHGGVAGAAIKKGNCKWMGGMGPGGAPWGFCYCKSIEEDEE